MSDQDNDGLMAAAGAMASAEEDDDLGIVSVSVGPDKIELSSTITLRDWFAGQALASMNLPRYFDLGVLHEDYYKEIKYICECAYLYADAMLKARKS